VNRKMNGTKYCKKWQVGLDASSGLKTNQIMVKYISVVVFLLSTWAVGIGQSLSNWLLTANLGVEKHDKRLFDYAEARFLHAYQPESWGTYHVEFNVRRKIFEYRRFSTFMGLGIGYEKATFERPYNQGILIDATYVDHILLHVNNYGKLQLPLSVNLFYELSDSWVLSGALVSNALLMRRINPPGRGKKYSGSFGTFEWEDIQLRCGINYRIGRWMLGLESRVINVQKIDRVIFNRIIDDPRTDQSWENHNPLRFDLTVGYTW